MHSHVHLSGFFFTASKKNLGISSVLIKENKFLYHKFFDVMINR